MAKNEKKTEKEVKVEKVEEVKIIGTEPVESEETKQLKAQLEEMRLAMQAMQALIAQNSQATPNVVKVVNQQEEVIIGCRLFQGVGWGDPKDEAGEIRLKFNEQTTVTVSDMKRFFRNYPVKRLFINGLCYFENPEDYEIFNIKEYKDLSNEALKEMFSVDSNRELLENLDKITENKKNSAVINCMIFRISKMLSDKSIDLSYDIRKCAEDYFDFEFNRGIRMIAAIESIR